MNGVQQYICTCDDLHTMRGWGQHMPGARLNRAVCRSVYPSHTGKGGTPLIIVCGTPATGGGGGGGSRSIMGGVARPRSVVPLPHWEGGGMPSVIGGVHRPWSANHTWGGGCHPFNHQQSEGGVAVTTAPLPRGFPRSLSRHLVTEPDPPPAHGAQCTLLRPPTSEKVLGLEGGMAGGQEETRP